MEGVGGGVVDMVRIGCVDVGLQGSGSSSCRGWKEGRSASVGKGRVFEMVA